MSKGYKVKRKKEEEVVVDTSALSKKELYDLNKEKKDALKAKSEKKKNKKKKNDTKQTNLGVRIFAIFMLVLMIASVVASAIAYLAY